MRFLFFTLSICLGLYALQSKGWAPTLELEPKEKQAPNFIVIFADDLGYGDLSCYGHPNIHTPQLDKMALEGQRWTDFYVASPVCTPSRAALLTGRYPIRNGMTSAKRGVLFPDSAGGLPASEITIAEVLKQKNYATAAVGKWHLGHLPEFLPMAQGFDYYYGIPYSNDMNGRETGETLRGKVNDPKYEWTYQDFDVPLLENGETIERPTDQRTITRRYTKKAIEFIQEQKDGPFFLYLAHSLPHVPLFAHPDRLGQSKQGLYGDVIEEIDWSVGQILAKVKELNLQNNTLVVFTSDNGPWLAYKTHGGSAGPLRAGKGTTFEGGQRVPAIFWGPGLVEAGRVDEMGSSLDLLQTFAVMADVSPPTDRKLDGFDLSGVLKDPKQQSPRTEFYYWSSNAELFALRSGPWKLHLKQADPILYWNPTIELEAPELYNLDADVSEKYNRATDQEKRVEELLKMAEAHKKDMSDALPDNLAALIEKPN